MTQRFDAVIIGWGKGGKTLAAVLAKKGKKVALIEKSPLMYGGTCINVGCIPTKTLVYAAHQARLCAPQSYEEKNALYQAALAKKNEVVSTLRQKNYDMLHDLPNVSIFIGTGSFVSPTRVRVQGANGAEEELEGDKIFINTGAQTAQPPIRGIENNPHVFTSSSVLDLPALPKELAVVGGGYIGLEFASLFANFGSRVTVLEGQERLLVRDDRQAVAALQEILQKRGVTFIFGAKVTSINGAAVNYILPDGAQKTLRADAVLLAAGRVPNTQDLNLQAAGIKTGPRGEVLTDERLRTTAPNVWAMGDVKGGAQFTYVSLDDYRVVLSDAFGEGARTVAQREPVPYAMFTDPALAHVGLTEDTAKAQGYDVKTKTIYVASIPRAKTLTEAEGLMKAVADARTGKILGVTLLAPDAPENINLINLAMKLDAPAALLRDFVFTHPTMSETFNDLFNL